jgi:DNA-binding protein HU-beta
MNKRELIAKIAADTKLGRSEAEDVIEATFETIVRMLQEGDDVRISGFGVFSVADRKAGKARNPKTGKIIRVKASKRVRFKPGKALRAAINRKV